MNAQPVRQARHLKATLKRARPLFNQTPLEFFCFARFSNSFHAGYDQREPFVSKSKRQKSPERWRPTLGPGFIVAAAFVGPGTVTTAFLAGHDYGTGLLWVIVFSVLAAIILQEMAARLGTLTGIGLGEMLRRQFPAKWSIALLSVLVVMAIGFGNAAYQTGNLTGASLGLQPLTGWSQPVLVIATACVASLLLWFGSYRWVERVLVAAVAVMGIAFLAAAAMTVWEWPFSSRELIPRLPAQSLTTVLALIGTTIVPYNLFLHASAASRRWAPVRPRDRGLRDARIDSTLGILAGGLVTASILIASAAVADRTPGEIGAESMSTTLVDLLGDRWAPALFAIGLGAAGMTSAITAPLAAAYALCGVLGWSAESNSWRFRMIWGTVILCGVAASLIWGSSPEQTILIAQAANAVALPVVAGILLLACNAKLLGRYANTRLSNALAMTVLVLVIILSVMKLIAASGLQPPT
jgi:NRAMP (natural resistance-associated macrophage protein)-like metal ion transporter